MPVAVSKRRFTVHDYHRMGEAGILSPRDRVELLDGEVVTLSPIGPRHGAAVDRATRAFVTAVGDSAIVRVQGSVRLDLYTEPEPDIVLLRPRSDFYASTHPGPSDILLIIEVADSSLEYDRDVKASVYASAGVPEYWIADVNEHRVHCFSEPASGTYRTMTALGRAHSLAPLLLPACTVSSDDLLA
jgi:Uma2 family endonuclease